MRDVIDGQLEGLLTDGLVARHEVVEGLVLDADLKVGIEGNLLVGIEGELQRRKRAQLHLLPVGPVLLRLQVLANFGQRVWRDPEARMGGRRHDRRRVCLHFRRYRDGHVGEHNHLVQLQVLGQPELNLLRPFSKLELPQRLRIQLRSSPGHKDHALRGAVCPHLDAGVHGAELRVGVLHNLRAFFIDGGLRAQDIQPRRRRNHLEGHIGSGLLVLHVAAPRDDGRLPVIRLFSLRQHNRLRVQLGVRRPEDGIALNHSVRGGQILKFCVGGFHFHVPYVDFACLFLPGVNIQPDNRAAFWHAHHHRVGLEDAGEPLELRGKPLLLRQPGRQLDAAERLHRLALCLANLRACPQPLAWLHGEIAAEANFAWPLIN